MVEISTNLFLPVIVNILLLEIWPLKQAINIYLGSMQYLNLHRKESYFASA